MDTKPKDTIITAASSDEADYEAHAATCDVCKFILTDSSAVARALADGHETPTVKDRIGLAFATAVGFAQACGVSGRGVACCELHGRLAVETFQTIGPAMLKARAEIEKQQIASASPKDADDRQKQDAAKPAAQRAN